MAWHCYVNEVQLCDMFLLPGIEIVWVQIWRAGWLVAAFWQYSPLVLHKKKPAKSIFLYLYIYIFFFLSIRSVWLEQQSNNRWEQGYARDEHSAPPAPAGCGSLGSCAPKQREVLPTGYAGGCLPSFATSSGLRESQVGCCSMYCKLRF